MTGARFRLGIAAQIAAVTTTPPEAHTCSCGTVLRGLRSTVLACGSCGMTWSTGPGSWIAHPGMTVIEVVEANARRVADSSLWLLA